MVVLVGIWVFCSACDGDALTNALKNGAGRDSA